MIEKQKKKEKAAQKQPVVEAATVQDEAVEQSNAEAATLTDDAELIAVIAAAIAASEGAASTDGFVVRSIKRANKNKWQRA